MLPKRSRMIKNTNVNSLKWKTSLALLAIIFLQLSCARSTSYKKEIHENAEVQPQAEKEEAVQKTKKFAAPKKRTIIMPFWNDTPVKAKFSKTAQKALKDLLRDSGMVNIVNDSHVS